MFRDGISFIPGETVIPILDKIVEYKISWIQHVNRMPWNRLPRLMKHYCPSGRRNHGRPLKRLLDTWDRNGSTSGPTPWQIYDDDDESSHTLLNPQFLMPYDCRQQHSPCSCSVFSWDCDTIQYFDMFCIVPVSAQLMTSSVKNLSQQNIRAAGSTASVSLAQVSFTEFHWVSLFAVFQASWKWYSDNPILF